MATLLFSAIGTLVGGPIGGLIGALAGRQVDSAILGRGNREGPRLKDLALTTSSYGSPLPRHFGTIRVPGTVIWATDLVEHAESQGGGKGKPSVTTYSYSASFAVALSSRPLRSVGRVWADGNLLRGAAGDLKTGGTFRLHHGHRDQRPDPLIEAAEGADRCPAWRGMAYAVFEDLDLSPFGNRIPALTFEVVADEADLSLALLAEGMAEGIDAEVPLGQLRGFSCEGPLAETLQALAPFYPMDCDGCGDRITIAPDRGRSAPLVLGDAAIATGDGDFGTQVGHARRRLPPPANPPGALRYYDVERDYQPGLQRAPARPDWPQAATLELPAALDAGNAQALITSAARRSGWAREILTWRTVELDPAVAPGTVVRAPQHPGLWRVTEWEWRDSGVELELERLSTTQPVRETRPVADPGRAVPTPDRAIGDTALAAFELPWSGAGAPDSIALYAATSSASDGWPGALLYTDRGEDLLMPLAPSGRRRATMGTATTRLGAASPLLVDRGNAVIVELLSASMLLADATPDDVARGANQALLGTEYIQFQRATPLGNRLWRLEHLLRGRGGTESAIGAHQAGEPFVLIDGAATALDPLLVGTAPQTRIAAIGLADAEPVRAEIVCRGIGLRPLSPVHPRVVRSGGALVLTWTRRARGAWAWLDGVDAPLHEQAERYDVGYGPPDAPLARWQTDAPTLTLDAATVSDLSARLPGGAFHVRQRGSYAVSEPLLLGKLSAMSQ